MFDIKKVIQEALDKLSKVSFEVDGVKGRVFFAPLNEELQEQYLEIEDGVKKQLFAATHGIAESDNGISIAEQYGEAVAVAVVTNEDAPEDFVALVADYVIAASGLDDNNEDDQDESTEEVTDQTLYAEFESGEHTV